VCSKIPPEVGELLGERIDPLLDFVSDHDGLLQAKYIATGGCETCDHVEENP
jgi:hypothetical protein